MALASCKLYLGFINPWEIPNNNYNNNLKGKQANCTYKSLKQLEKIKTNKFCFLEFSCRTFPFYF